MKSLYGQYIAEREGYAIVESEVGFATYTINGDSCYIADIFVLPEYRKTKEALSMANMITQIAKNFKCTHLISTVCPSTAGSTESLKSVLSYGFKLTSSRDNLILFRKEI